MGALLGLIPLIGSVLPNLIPALATPMLGNILGKAGDIATKIFGTTDPNQISLAIQKDQSKLEQFKAELEAATEDEKLAFQDIQSARQQTMTLAGAGSLIAWGAPIISTMVTLGFFTILMLYMYSPAGADNAVVTMLVGTMATSFGAVVQYWIGSSVGSKDKDSLMASMSSTTQRDAASTAKDLASKVIVATVNTAKK
jgi:hypothetical protein